MILYLFLEKSKFLSWRSKTKNFENPRQPFYRAFNLASSSVSYLRFASRLHFRQILANSDRFCGNCVCVGVKLMRYKFIDTLQHSAGSEASGLQPVGWCVVYHHQLQKCPFRASKSSKIETESQRDTTKCPTTGCPAITQPCSKVEWYDVQHIPFCKTIRRKVGSPSTGIQREGYGRDQFLRRAPISEK